MEHADLKSKRQQAGALMSAAGCLSYKADVLSPYGVDRIRDLAEPQLDDLIGRLQAMSINRNQISQDIRKARSTILSLCDGLGIKPQNGSWKAVNEFLMQKRVAGKLLYEMNLDELKSCALRIRAISRKRDDRIDEETRLAESN